jgi:hypothetical protein
VIRGALVAIVLLAACTAPEVAQPTPSTEPTAAPTFAAEEPSVAPTAAPSSEPTVRLPEIPITVATGSFPIESTLALRAAPINEEAIDYVRGGITRYLEMLDHFRATGATNRNALSVSGKFGDAVFYGIKASQDVERKFTIGSLRVDRYLVKPWGTRALADATVTIVDKAVNGSLPDQTETGRLRLVGDRLFVVDAWDYANNRWFNGPAAITAAEVREAASTMIGWHLGYESWIPGSAVAQFGSDETPFWRARRQYIASFDRSKIISRTFADVRATIERYEGFPEIRDGFATVRVSGTIVTADATGAPQRTPFQRVVKLFFGNWIPEVIDEQITSGVWLSGGDLALATRDVNAA